MIEGPKESPCRFVRLTERISCRRCLRFMPEDYGKLEKLSARLRVNAPPSKGGGFGLRLKAGLVRRTADLTTARLGGID